MMEKAGILIVGFALGFFIAAGMAASVDREVEKRGIWTVGDRAYRLSPVVPPR